MLFSAACETGSSTRSSVSVRHLAEEKTCFIAGFYELRDGRIAWAKIYREGSAALA
jgi:uncharacterized protein